MFNSSFATLRKKKQKIKKRKTLLNRLLSSQGDICNSTLRHLRGSHGFYLYKPTLDRFPFIKLPSYVQAKPRESVSQSSSAIYYPLSRLEAVVCYQQIRSAENCFDNCQQSGESGTVPSRAASFHTYPRSLLARSPSSTLMTQPCEIR